MRCHLWKAVMVLGISTLLGCSAYSADDEMADGGVAMRIDDSNLVPPPASVSYDFLLTGEERVIASLRFEKDEWHYRILLNGAEISAGNLTATSKLEPRAILERVYILDTRSPGATYQGLFVVVFSFFHPIREGTGFLEVTFNIMGGKLISTSERIAHIRLEPYVPPQ